ncbi:MAG: NAD-dependent deacetylase, partial [Deltaproteobacteria bacterium]|nr:NAD-dependent deacetylase [Deltaproteobacteria bacterium]
MPDLEHQIRTAAEWIAESHHLVVFTGAGISTDSGLPDYRGPDGVWTRRDKGLPPPKWGVAPDQVRPNRGHLALVALQEMGLLGFLISQNVDGLHLASGIEPERIAELHGNTNLVKCLGCDGRYANTSVGWDKEVWGPGYRTHRPRPGQPVCPTCGGRLISSIVNFDDPMPEHEVALAYRHSEASDLFFAIGSSLVVSPANDMPAAALRKGARLILLNMGETPFGALAHLCIAAPIGEVLPLVVEEVRHRRM